MSDPIITVHPLRSQEAAPLAYEAPTDGTEHQDPHQGLDHEAQLARLKAIADRNPKARHVHILSGQAPGADAGTVAIHYSRHAQARSCLPG